MGGGGGLEGGELGEKGGGEEWLVGAGAMLAMVG